MLVDLGALSIIVSFVVSLLVIIFSGLGIYEKKDRYAQVARYGIYANFLLLSAAMLSLLTLLYETDLTVSYVINHSSEATATFYKLSSLWAGPSGSYLLWNFLNAFFAAVYVFLNRHKARSEMPHSFLVLGIIMAFFSFINSFYEDAQPFLQYSQPAVIGRGLNPLLLHWAMIIHPPILYVGYVSFSVPFSIAMGTLLSRNYDAGWLRSIRRWAIFSWFFLGTGICLGMKWAYEELGWGGYWAWDPVENASFMPWLLCTAFIHSIIVQERRNMLRIWNMLLMLLTYHFCLLGTWITRSGILEGPHSFADSSFGPPFFFFILFSLIAYGWFLYDRRGDLKSERVLESLTSKETSFLLNNLILLSITVLILIGVMVEPITKTLHEFLPNGFGLGLPELSAMWGWLIALILFASLFLSALFLYSVEAEKERRFWRSIVTFFAIALPFELIYFVLATKEFEVTVQKAPWYNAWVVPFFIALLFLMGIGPLQAWRKSVKAVFYKSMLWPFAFAITGFFVAPIILGVYTPHLGYFDFFNESLFLACLCFAFIVLIFAGTIQEMFRGYRARRLNFPAENKLFSVYRFIGRNKRRYAGYLIHMSLAIMAFGFIGKSIESNTKLDFYLDLNDLHPGAAGGQKVAKLQLMDDGNITAESAGEASAANQRKAIIYGAGNIGDRNYWQGYSFEANRLVLEPEFPERRLVKGERTPNAETVVHVWGEFTLRKDGVPLQIMRTGQKHHPQVQPFTGRTDRSQPSSHPAIYSIFKEDVYVQLGSIGRNDGGDNPDLETIVRKLNFPGAGGEAEAWQDLPKSIKVTLRLWLNPLVIWVWIGSIFVALSALIIVLPYGERRTVQI